MSGYLESLKTPMNIHYPLLLDGGLSNELERQGHDLNHNLWSAKLLDTQPESIVQAHLAYLEAGAQCIITASYQASVAGFTELGYDQSVAKSFIKKSVALAEEARALFLAAHPNIAYTPLIAASVGPYGAYLADGSEYVGNYGVSDEVLRDFHLDRIHLLDDTNADCFACETIPSFQEATILADILQDTQKPAWISFSCKDDQHINDGTPIEACMELLTDHPKVFAVGVNCTAPKYVSGLIKTIKANIGDKKVIVYPNSGEVYNAQSKTWQGISDPDLFAEVSKEWRMLGADIVGGCCRIGTSHIEKMRTDYV